MEILYVGRNRNSHDLRLVDALKSKFSVTEIYSSKVNANIIHENYISKFNLVVVGPISYELAMIPEKINIPVIGISHAFDINIESEDSSIKRNILKCSGIICDCNYSFKILKEKYEFRGKLFEIPFGCDQSFYSEAQIQFSNKIKILVVRNWFEVYRNDLILKALEEINERGIDFECTFIGDGPLLAENIRLYQESPIFSKIRFKGQQDKFAIRAEMSRNWLYISASSSDGSSISLLEAMSAGMICLVSDFPSNLEWITPESNGLLFRNGDFSDLAIKIEQTSLLTLQDKIKYTLISKEIVTKKGNWVTNRDKFIEAVRGFI